MKSLQAWRRSAASTLLRQHVHRAAARAASSTSPGPQLARATSASTARSIAGPVAPRSSQKRLVAERGEHSRSTLDTAVGRASQQPCSAAKGGVHSCAARRAAGAGRCSRCYGAHRGVEPRRPGQRMHGRHRPHGAPTEDTVFADDDPQVVDGGIVQMHQERSRGWCSTSPDPGRGRSTPDPQPERSSSSGSTDVAAPVRPARVGSGRSVRADWASVASPDILVRAPVCSPPTTHGDNFVDIDVERWQWAVLLGAHHRAAPGRPPGVPPRGARRSPPRRPRSSRRSGSRSVWRSRS